MDGDGLVAFLQRLNGPMGKLTVASQSDSVPEPHFPVDRAASDRSVFAAPRSLARPVHGTKLRCFQFQRPVELAVHAARVIAGLLRDRMALGQPAVLGLATGSTPVATYRELIRMHREEGLDFSHAVIFGLGEYFGLASHCPQSHRQWIESYLTEHVNVPANQVFVPDGMVPQGDVDAMCRQYDGWIERAGGLDMVVCGIGRNGHVAFNEPFSAGTSRTRLCTLDPVTRRAAASDFFGEDHVPTQAITLGMRTIMSARQILLLAVGEHKANVVREVLEGPITERLPASFLQQHTDARVLADAGAAGALTGIATPWQINNVSWTPPLMKRAVLWLAKRTGKALLKLDEEDFRAHDLHQLVRHHGPAQQLAQRVFSWMMDTLQMHPVGLEKKRSLCFSPHPDDDVISMGGTLIRLNGDGHEVHIAYMTSGNIAVFDHDALRVADLVAEYNRLFGIDQERSHQVLDDVRRSLASKQAGQPDEAPIQQIKGLIRWSEARAGAVQVGCSEEHLHFLDLPFYRTGTVAKRPVGHEDVDIIRQLLLKVQPDVVFVAGDLADPHGTHRMCAEAIFAALTELRDQRAWSPEVLLYRGAWQEYALHEIEIAVPLSPDELDLKRQAIFMHESQKDEALFPGSDPREFWQRAEDRNRGTASEYNQIGLPEFFALEAFTRWDGKPI
jgi:glucosamine-6-phosphate deaminase